MIHSQRLAYQDGDTLHDSQVNVYALIDAPQDIESWRLEVGQGQKPVEWETLAQGRNRSAARYHCELGCEQLAWHRHLAAVLQDRKAPAGVWSVGYAGADPPTPNTDNDARATFHRPQPQPNHNPNPNRDAYTTLERRAC
jgi:hypothetical protein